MSNNRRRSQIVMMEMTPNTAQPIERLLIFQKTSYKVVLMLKIAPTTRRTQVLKMKLAHQHRLSIPVANSFDTKVMMAAIVTLIMSGDRTPSGADQSLTPHCETSDWTREGTIGWIMTMMVTTVMAVAMAVIAMTVLDTVKMAITMGLKLESL